MIMFSKFRVIIMTINNIIIISIVTVEVIMIVIIC